MEKLETVRDTLSAIFSIETGLEEESQAKILRNALKEDSFRNRIERELILGLSDLATPWEEFLFNHDYEILETQDRHQAREFIIENLWNRVFPGTQAPTCLDKKNISP